MQETKVDAAWYLYNRYVQGDAERGALYEEDRIYALIAMDLHALREKATLTRAQHFPFHFFPARHRFLGPRAANSLRTGRAPEARSSLHRHPLGQSQRQCGGEGIAGRCRIDDGCGVRRHTIGRPLLIDAKCAVSAQLDDHPAHTLHL